MAQLEAERPKKWPPSCDILDKSKFKYPHWPTIDLLLSIDMAKALPVFQKLEVDDQVPFFLKGLKRSHCKERIAAFLLTVLTETLFFLKNFACLPTFGFAQR